MQDPLHSKIQQILEIDPPLEIIFNGKLNDIITTNIVLRNPANKRVSYKVKTTAPKQYCVRPNCGTIAPGSSKEVSVILQPLDQETLKDTVRHKFMIQSAFTPDNLATGIEDVFKILKPTEISHSKLAAKFILEESDATGANITNQSNSNKNGHEAPPADDFMTKKLMQENSQLSNENHVLHERNVRLQNEQERLIMELGIPTIQVLLATIAALLFGLILGRLF